jgi:hypothetical protein
MRINVDRLCELAGINAGRTSLNEAGNRSYHEDPSLSADAKIQFSNQLNEIDEEDGDDDPPGLEEDPMEEIIEVDEAMLVQELRRAKKIMSESKKRKVTSRRKKSLQEAELKRIIEHEVQSVLKDLNLSSGWIYGKDKPKNSRQGYLHQGTFLKGIGFK